MKKQNEDANEKKKKEERSDGKRNKKNRNLTKAEFSEMNQIDWYPVDTFSD